MNSDTAFGTWLHDFAQRLGTMAVDVLVFLAVLVAALAVGWLIRALLARVLRAVGFDALADRSGADTTLRRAGLARRPSDYVARFIGMLAVLVVALSGALSLRIPGTEMILANALAFVPALLTAVLIIVIGTMLAEFAARGILITSVNAGWRGARLVSGVTRLLVLALAVAMALDQLAVARAVVVATFSIVLGGVVLALALAFGLGGRDIAREYLKRYVVPPPETRPGTEIDNQ
ncbi:MAG: mechanosensitive ion channel family protein [Thermoanaerobaculia bacterium]